RSPVAPNTTQSNTGTGMIFAAIATSPVHKNPSPTQWERMGEGEACRTHHPHLASPATAGEEL
ncbi:MAG TPA: hypothetical protein VK822_03930, partial [Acetobacteraceae bacterium]|nr:hypothetical protein [Acetobacteraceae bacterium]